MKGSIKNGLVIAALVAAAAGCAQGGGARESTGQYVDDSVITTRVKSAMVADKDVSAMNINVTTLKGEVQLSGFANSSTEAQKAVSIARNVPGVKSVKNDIRVR